MRKREKAKKIRKILDGLYPSPPYALEHKDSYTLLIAVVLSAQCTDARVNKITPNLYARADNPHDMAQLPVEAIEELIRPCGMAKNKSRAIQELSRRIVENYGGNVPDNFAALESLPGVGHKTASVVMAQAFGHPAFPVDTHIHRCARRWGLTEGKSVSQTEADLKKLFPIDCWNKIHLQIVYFGRQYCKARGHVPEQCPICSWIC